MASVGKDYIRLSHDMAWIPVEDEPTESGAPSSAMFSDGNGGEYVFRLVVELIIAFVPCVS